MSEQPPNQPPLPEESEDQRASGYDPNSGFTYKQYLEQGGETGQALRERVAAEIAADQSASSQSEMPLRPVNDGEFTRLVTEKPELLSPEGDEDGISATALAAMAHEPWTTDVKEEPPEEPPETPEEPPEEPPETPEEPEPTPEESSTSPELESAQAEVEVARTELARLRAGRESATFFSIKYSKKKVEAAFQRYEEAKAKAGAIAVDLLREKGVEGKELVGAINWGSMVEATDLIDEQYEIEQQAVDSKRLKGFYNWWKDQGTKLFSKGSLKKSLVMGAIGVPVGVGAAIVAAPILAGAGLAAGGGAAIGAGIARSVSKGLVGNAIRRNANAESVAEGKRQFRLMEAKQLIDAFDEQDEVVQDEYIGKISRDQTKDVKKGNDRRALTSAAVGAGGALVGYMAAEGVMNWLDGNGPTPPVPPTETYNSAGADRMTGILTQRPGAEQDWLNLQDALPPDAVDADAIRIDEIYNDVKDTLSPSENSVLNQAIGRLSATEGYGNAWTAQHMNDLIRLAQEGNSLDDIIAKV